MGLIPCMHGSGCSLYLVQSLSAGLSTQLGDLQGNHHVPAATPSCNCRSFPSAGVSLRLPDRTTMRQMHMFSERCLSLPMYMLQDNNVIALGLEDAVVAIYNVRLDVVQHSMKAHEAAVTGATNCARCEPAFHLFLLPAFTAIAHREHRPRRTCLCRQWQALGIRRPRRKRMLLVTV